MTCNFIDLLGYAASATIVLSFALKKVNQIRVINSIGCLLFVIYGILTPAYPVAVANGAIIAINVYYLFKQKKK